MALRFVFAVALLLGLWPLWAWLGPNRTTLDGWLLSAYAIVFAALGAYRVGLAERERHALVAWTARAGTHAPIERRSRWLGVLEQLALFTLAIGVLLALVYAPEEKTMGQIQKIFYVHVPSAWVAFLAFLVVAGASVVYLATRSPGADRVARASAEVGVLFTTLVLITGPIWARPVWGIWWTWDARLTTTLVLWIVYIGYLMLRAYVADSERQATLGAVVGILGSVGVYIDYMAIRWWRTQHPAPVIGGGEGSGLEPRMARAFVIMLLAFTLAYLALLVQRVAIARLEARNLERELREGDPVS